MVRVYARLIAVALLALALVGFSGVLDIEWTSNLYHAVLGVIFLYVGFLERDRDSVRQEVGVVGVMVLVTKAFVILALLLAFGFFEYDLREVTCIVVGISSLLVAKYLPDGQPASLEGEEPTLRHAATSSMTRDYLHNQEDGRQQDGDHAEGDASFCTYHDDS